MQGTSDKLLLALVLILVAFGVVMVYSTSGLHAEEQGNQHHFLLRHLISVLVGLTAMAIVAAIPYEVYQRPGVVYSFLTLAFALLIFTLIPGIGGASALTGALRVGFWGALAMALTSLIGSLFHTAV